MTFQIAQSLLKQLNISLATLNYMAFLLHPPPLVQTHNHNTYAASVT